MMTIDKTIEEIDELPDTDNVHCYDYEIRTDDLKALAAELKQLREFVGAMNSVGIEEWYGRWQKDGTFAFFDHDHHLIASGTDPFDAWRKMNAGEDE